MGDVAESVGSFMAPVTGKADPKDQNAAAGASAAYTNLMAGIARQYYKDTAETRNSVLNRLGDFMNGNLDPTESVQYAPIKMNTERQYKSALDALMESTPEGGALYEGMANLAGQKANTLSEAIAQIVLDEYNKAYGVATGSPQVTLSGMGGAAGNANALVNALTGQTVASQGSGPMFWFKRQVNDVGDIGKSYATMGGGGGGK